MHELLDIAEVARRLKLGRMKVPTMELEDFMRRYAGHDVTNPHNVKKLEAIQ